MYLILSDLLFARDILGETAIKHQPDAKQIFVLDDDPSVLETLRLILKGAGYNVV